jgi:organic hydroperoxide reductase OsmC/OhrA
MKPLPHRYDVRLSAGPTGYVRLGADGLPELVAAPPLDFDGPGDAWSPEHLLLAAIETCFVFTFRAIAKASRLDFTALDVVTEGVVDRADGRVRFVEIVLRPRVTLAVTADRHTAHRVIERSEHACIVSASLAVPLRVEAEIVSAVTAFPDTSGVTVEMR